MHGLYTYLENNPGRRQERLHELSHGEGFLEILRTRVNQPGFYLMDEPDAPLHLIGHWRRFLTDPASYYRHLLAD